MIMRFVALDGKWSDIEIDDEHAIISDGTMVHINGRRFRADDGETECDDGVWRRYCHEVSLDG